MIESDDDEDEEEEEGEDELGTSNEEVEVALGCDGNVAVGEEGVSLGCSLVILL